MSRIPCAYYGLCVDQGEQPEDVIIRTARVSKVFLDVADGVLIEYPIEHIGRLAFRRTDGRDGLRSAAVDEILVAFNEYFLTTFTNDG